MHLDRALNPVSPYAVQERKKMDRLNDVENCNSINHKGESMYLIIEDSLLSMQEDQSQKLTIHVGE